MCVGVFALSACATRLDPISLPPEYALPPSQSELWQALSAERDDEWHYLLNDGPTALDWRLRAIDSATESIDFQSFLWTLDTSGKLFLGHIIAAADRGVRIRIIMDDTFLLDVNESLVGLDSHPNIEYRIFNPYKRRVNHLITREILNLSEFHRLDHRMHNKVLLVDNRVAIVGGRNIADEYFGLHEAANFRDMELISAGPIVQAISNGFDLYWNSHWSFPVHNIIDSSSSKDAIAATRSIGNIVDDVHREEDHLDRVLRWMEIAAQANAGRTHMLLDEPPISNLAARDEAPVQLATEIYELIDQASQEIRIVTAYLIPTAEFEAAVERAEKRGVEVHILTNSIRSNNHLVAHSAYRNHIHRLLKHGANLYEIRVDAKDRQKYIQAPIENKTLALHAKMMVIDGVNVFIGSANMDPRSLRMNTEVGLLIQSPELGQRVLDEIEADFLPVNAWRLNLLDSGEVQWESDDETLTHLPAASFMQSIEDWFFARLPIEGEM
jgi:putative cardiolipin synthase